MPARRSLLRSASALVAATLILPTAAWADEPTPVIATFSILGDIVERIGGDHVTVTTLVGRNGDAHVYQPTPQAARAVSEADILFMNGLEFEGWLERLSEAAAFDGSLVVATKGIEPIAFEEHDDHDDHGEEHAEHGNDHGDREDEHAGHDHGAFDPHAWLSPKLAVTYADNITAALAQADPEHAAIFYENRAGFVAELEALDAEINAMMTALPEERRIVVTSHDAFQYFARDYGLTFEAPQGLSTDSEASAQDVAQLIEQMREQNISAVFVENIADSRLLEQIANETGATLGGTLYPGALSEPDGPAATYLDLMRHNATTLSQALGS
ncbi:metal ABC transporter substrate-binding protein [Actibacterium sp. 188UL27-1]|uniref:metal ABC transporter substrate-binding protein n=1 Tax=Actibacterium sp. 188UL27-1 TaxID=2786961 RepID=UPI00195E4B45|nr:metal ABC transporter substrate-binding protein [Actibacterium sp. 188UL27-1]MBM7070331.1 metal ABC transporter substrate-binding protein [Actibacterium sp. 188UL27-1]